MKPKKPKAIIPLEHDSQVTVIDWCNANHVKYPCLKFIYSCPNGAATSSINQAKRLLAEGLKPGVPDLCLPYPIKIHYEIFWHGLYIEMKRKGKTTSPEQDKWLDYLSSVGYKTAVAYSADEAIEIIKGYLS